jgi:hypothetical protein
MSHKPLAMAAAASIFVGGGLRWRDGATLDEINRGEGWERAPTKRIAMRDRVCAEPIINRQSKRQKRRAKHRK